MAKWNFITKVDPNIIGGFQLQVGSDLLDASVLSQLQNIKKSLLEKA
jgi:F0F1-type ATP synthase delta subunit